MTSPYLLRPLRTIDQALADAGAKLVEALCKLPQAPEVPDAPGYER